MKKYFANDNYMLETTYNIPLQTVASQCCVMAMRSSTEDFIVHVLYVLYLVLCERFSSMQVWVLYVS